MILFKYIIAKLASRATTPKRRAMAGFVAKESVHVV
jgi:hypothetical protein